MACGPLKKKTHSWTHSYSGAVQTRLKFAKFNLPHAFQPAPAPTLADSFLYGIQRLIKRGGISKPSAKSGIIFGDQLSPLIIAEKGS